MVVTSNMGSWNGATTDGNTAAIAMAFTSAAIFSFIGRISNKLKPWQPFPFAPFICISMQSVWILDKDFGIVQLFVRYG